MTIFGCFFRFLLSENSFLHFPHLTFEFLASRGNERHLLMFCFHGILRSDFSLNLERKRTHGLNANIVRKSLTLIDFLKSHVTESWQTMKILYESLGWLSQSLWCWMMKFELIMFFFNTWHYQHQQFRLDPPTLPCAPWHWTLLQKVCH